MKGTEEAQSFLRQRTLALAELCKHDFTSSDSRREAASKYLHDALTIGHRCLLKVQRVEGAIEPLVPLIETVRGLFNCLRTIREEGAAIPPAVPSTPHQVLMDDIGRLLRLYASLREVEEVAQRTLSPFCSTCGAAEAEELEEDEDNPGIFYCVLCWEDYANGQPVVDKVCYSIDELKAIRHKDAFPPGTPDKLSDGSPSEIMLKRISEAMPPEVCLRSTDRPPEKSKRDDKRRQKRNNPKGPKKSSSATSQLPVSSPSPAAPPHQSTALQLVKPSCDELKLEFSQKLTPLKEPGHRPPISSLPEKTIITDADPPIQESSFPEQTIITDADPLK